MRKGDGKMYTKQSKKDNHAEVKVILDIKRIQRENGDRR